MRVSIRSLICALMGSSPPDSAESIAAADAVITGCPDRKCFMMVPKIVSAHPRVLTDGEWASCEVVGCRMKIVDAITGDSIQASGGPVRRPQSAQSERKGYADPGVVETA